MEEVVNKSKKKASLIKSIIQLLIFLGLGVFFIWLSVRGLTADDLEMIKQSAAQVTSGYSWIFLVCSLICGILAFYFRSARSVLLMESMNYRVRKSMSFYAVTVCYLANLAFPRLGEVLRCTFLQRYEKVPFQKALGSIVTERALDLIIFFALAIVATLLNTSILTDLIVNKEEGISVGMWIENSWNSLIHGNMLYILIAVCVLIVLIIYFTRKTKWWEKIPFFPKIKHVLHGVWQGLVSIKDLKRPYLFVFHTIMIWVAYFFGIYSCFFAFDFLSGLGIVPALTCLAYGSVGFMIAQGGIGAYPLIIAGILGLYGVDYNAGLAAGWVGWSVQTLTTIVVGFLCLLLASLTEGKKNEQIGSSQI